MLPLVTETKTFNVRVRMRAGHDVHTAGQTMMPVLRFLDGYNASMTQVPDRPGDVLVAFQLGAPDSLAAAQGALGLIQGAFVEQGKPPPAPLGRVEVETFPATGG
jgi:hypothetical protein